VCGHRCAAGRPAHEGRARGRRRHLYGDGGDDIISETTASITAARRVGPRSAPHDGGVTRAETNPQSGWGGRHDIGRHGRRHHPSAAAARRHDMTASRQRLVLGDCGYIELGLSGTDAGLLKQIQDRHAALWARRRNLGQARRRHALGGRAPTRSMATRATTWCIGDPTASHLRPGRRGQHHREHARPKKRRTTALAATNLKYCGARTRSGAASETDILIGGAFLATRSKAGRRRPLIFRTSRTLSRGTTTRPRAFLDLRHARGTPTQRHSTARRRLGGQICSLDGRSEHPNDGRTGRGLRQGELFHSGHRSEGLRRRQLRQRYIAGNAANDVIIRLSSAGRYASRAYGLDRVQAAGSRWGHRAERQPTAGLAATIQRIRRR